MSTLEEIKARAEAVEDDVKVITLEEAYEIAVQSQDDVPKLVAALEAALVTADELIEENQDATTLQSWGLMIAARKVRQAITEALR